MVAKMRNAGEACTAANRFYVQRGIHDAFVAKLAERMGAMKMGPGTESATQCGAMINRQAIDKIEHLVADAVGRGAEVRLGGRTPQGAGRSEEHTSELQSLMRTSYAVFCLKKK